MLQKSIKVAPHTQEQIQTLRNSRSSPEHQKSAHRGLTWKQTGGGSLSLRESVRVNAGELRMQRFSLALASGERVGVRGLSGRIFPHPDPLPEGDGTLIHQHYLNGWRGSGATFHAPRVSRKSAMSPKIEDLKSWSFHMESTFRRT